MAFSFDAAERTPPEKTPRIPLIPLGAYGLILITIGAILYFPPRLRAKRERERLRTTGRAPMWMGHTMAGECLVTAWVVHPESLEGQALADLPADRLGVKLRLDNRRGTRAARLALSGARFCTLHGRVLPGADVDKTETVALPPGAPPHVAIFPFPRAAVLEAQNSLYALQVEIDGQPLTVPGLYYEDPDEARTERLNFESRVVLLPVYRSTEPDENPQPAKPQ